MPYSVESTVLCWLTEVTAALACATRQEDLCPCLEAMRLHLAAGGVAIDEICADRTERLALVGECSGKPSTVAYFALDNTQGHLTLYDAPSQDGAVSSDVLANMLAVHCGAALARMRCKQRRDEFFATLAHELRSPLSAIRLSADLLGRADVKRHEGDNLQRVIARQVDNMARLVDDLLELARIPPAQFTLTLEPIDLAAVIRRSVETVQAQTQARGHRLETRLAADGTWLWGDALRLEQIVINLLTNAIKYTLAGGCIWVTLEACGDKLELVVRDSGIGIAPEMLPRVFDLYTQAKMSLRSGRGFGIGLSVVRSLVELHGGTVGAHSDGIGFGSTFIVRLPRIQGDVSERVSPSYGERLQS